MEEMFLSTASMLLRWSAIACLILSFSGVVENTMPTKKMWLSLTILEVAYTVCNLATSSACAWHAFTLIQGTVSQPMAETLKTLEISAYCILSILLIISPFLSVYFKWRRAPASFLIWGAHGLQLSSLVNDLLMMWHALVNEPYYCVDPWVMTTNITAAFLAAGSFLFSGLHDIPGVPKRNDKKSSPRDEDKHSVFRKLVCTSVFRHIWNTGFHDIIKRENLCLLVESTRCRLLANALAQQETKNNAGSSPWRFATCVLRVLRGDLVWCLLCNCAYYTSLIVRIPILEKLLSAESVLQACTLTGLFSASCAAEFLLGCVEADRTKRLCVRMKSLLLGAVFSTMVHMDPSALRDYSSGHFVSLMAVDCTRISVTAYNLPRLIVGLLCAPFIFYVLVLRVGALPVVCSASWMLFSLLALTLAVKWEGKLWKSIIKYHDIRLERITDILSCVRLVKLYAWEETFARMLTRLRRPEVQRQFYANLVDGVYDSFFVSSSAVMTTILFATLSWFHSETVMTAALSFPCIYAMTLLDPVNTNLLTVTRLLLMCSHAARRISTSCTEKRKCTKSGTKGEDTYSKEGCVTLTECSFARKASILSCGRSSDVCLKDVTFHLKPASLVGVVGTVGSGKSTLLLSLQAEMHCLRGECKTWGSMAFVPQHACIYNMSIMDNILFGKPLNYSYYMQVINACGLLKDIAQLPAGDLTEVGEKGATLSGGQKQRIALARAVYSDSSIYLLDDTLSALDVHVASDVFHRIIGPRGILSNKTRIVVCNQGKYLKHMDKILLVVDKRVHCFETYEQFVREARFEEATDHGKEQNDKDSKHASRNSQQIERGDGVTGRVTEDEVETSKTSSMDLIVSAIRMGSPWFVFACVTFIIRAAAVGAYLVWVKEWTDSSRRENYSRPWVAGIAGLCFSDVFFGCLGAFFLALGFQQVSSRIHNEMAWRVLSSPFRFFDATPRGRVLNRFSTDLDNIDTRLFMATKQVMQTLPVAAARITVTGLQSLAAGLLGALAAAIFIVLVAYLAKASNAARRLESVDYSRLLQHLTETCDSVAVVRSYGVQERFCRHCYRLVDATIRGLATYIDIIRSVRFLGGLCGVLITFVTVAFLMSEASASATYDGSSIGLAISSSMGIAILFTAATSGVFLFFQTAVSFERCLEYTRLTPEDDTCRGRNPEVQKKRTSKKSCRIPSYAPALVPEGWPSKGKLQFRGYTASYRPGMLPDVLVDLNFTVDSCEKVGVVGRTGAGKSSLVMALLRVLKATAGSIYIDGVDIESVPLRTLRSVITIIPQDPSLMRGTLREVLDPTCTCSDEEVRKALKEVHLSDFVAQHPKNILMELGDAGGNLSAGQKQLVCLARAILRKSRILVLDEATSHMDDDTDRLIQKTLRRGFRSCTMLTIAHRLNTVLDHDKILVMDGGHVAEFGATLELASNPSSRFHVMLSRAGLTLADVHRYSEPSNSVSAHL